MALSVKDHIWTIAELVQVALEPSNMPPLPKEPETTLRPSYRLFKLRVIRGGQARVLAALTPVGSSRDGPIAAFQWNESSSLR
jgi:hypothetical protein